eukprot:8845983-Alexandrium_andersonii.AAC.1
MRWPAGAWPNLLAPSPLGPVRQVLSRGFRPRRGCSLYAVAGGRVAGPAGPVPLGLARQAPSRGLQPRR